MARLAEQAYRFERDDETPAARTVHWDAAARRAAGRGSVLVELQALERRFLETDHRGSR